MAGSLRPHIVLLVFLTVLASISSCMAEIKNLKISSDFRAIILFEKFGFTRRGEVAVAVSDVSISSTLGAPDHSLLGFFLPSDESLIQAAYDSQHGRSSYSDTKPSPNTGCVLHSSYSPVPSLYTFFAAAFFAVWIHLALFKNRLAAHRLHHLMAGLLFTKALNLIFAAEDQHYIRQTGTPHGWDVLFYLFQFLKGVLLFTVIVLIGTGWSFLKPFLQEREKKVLMIVIPLQVVANIASVVIGETGPFIRDWTSKTDGKAARNVAKLTLFRQFYTVVIGYLYFTRVVVYALKTITSYKYRWVSVAAEETASLAFYIFMFYMFRPVEKNHYFALDDEEEEAAEMVLRDEEFEL
ncbi:unnamed protein product [Musa acuminata subsp. malaccensis]|uniref:(wild Malaysian banana) hypothetical protein n=1 Tax=Musa acuminata subsp. malaccensis TaxID=214687 RepID=A0A804K253_MUSAM|nr:unnamed protein product [Musa acuminata subsp. malaccensis]